MFAHGLNYTRHLSICNVAVNLGYSVFCPTDAVKTAECFGHIQTRLAQSCSRPAILTSSD